MNRTDIKMVINIYLLMNVFICEARGAAIGGDAPSKDQVVSEYKAAIEKISGQFANISGSGRYISHKNIGLSSEHLWAREIEFARFGEQGKLATNWGTGEVVPGGPVETKLAKDGSKEAPPRRPHGEVVRCFNKKYAMELRRDMRSRPFAVHYFSGDIESVKLNIARSFDEFWNCGANTHGFPVAKLMALPTLSVDRIAEEISPKNTQLLKIAFSIAVPPSVEAKNKKGLFLRSGWLLVSPQEHWVLVGYALRTTGDGLPTRISMGSVEYEGQEDGWPIPKRVTTRVLWYPPGAKEGESQGKTLEEETFEFTKFRFGPVPDREFTAAAFGLPELDKPGPARHEDRTGLWLIGLATVAFVGSMVLRYLARRPRPT